KAEAYWKKGGTVEYKKEVDTFGDKEDGVSSELKEESINEIKKLKNYLTNEQLKASLKQVVERATHLKQR
ncbi:17736_t:CDS:2, partial [Cetraspora pellucida]